MALAAVPAWAQGVQASRYDENAAGGGWDRVSSQAAASDMQPAATPGQVRAANVRQAAVTWTSTTEVKDGGLALPNAIKLVENYFNGLTTLQADFTQETSGDVVQKGVFYLDRPVRKFIWAYTSPEKQRVIATGTATYFEGNGQVTQLPSNAGLARFFTAKKLNLSDEGIRVSGTRQSAGQQSVMLEMDKSKMTEDQAALRKVELTFTNEADPVLQRVSALDATGATTTITFGRITTGQRFEKGFFDFTPGVYSKN